MHFDTEGFLDEHQAGERAEEEGRDAENSSCTERTPLFYSFAYAPYGQRVDAFPLGAAPPFHQRAAAEGEEDAERNYCLSRAAKYS